MKKHIKISREEPVIPEPDDGTEDNSDDMKL